MRNRVWQRDTFVVFDDSLNTAIRKVRDVLGDAKRPPRFIETVPRRGYRFIGSVEIATSRQEVGTQATEAARPARDLQGAEVAIPVRDRTWRRWQVAAAVSALISCSALTAWSLHRSTVQGASLVQFQVVAPDGLMFPNRGTSPLATLSPDGRRFVFITETPVDHVYRLWMHDLDSVKMRPLPGTENAWMPFWSPDGTRLGFASSGVLRIIDVESSNTTPPLVDVNADGGACWTLNGDIVFGNRNGGLTHIAAGGGRPVTLTTPDRAVGERRHLWPQALPGGRTFLFFVQNDRPEESGVFLASFESPQRRTRVLTTRATALYAPPGYLLYLTEHDRTLVAQQFDANTGRLAGSPLPIASGVGVNYVNGRVRFTVSNTGVLAYSGDSGAQILQPVWFDRDGRRLDAPMSPDHYTRFELSSDSRLAAVERLNPDEHAPDILVADLTRRVTWRATPNRANDENPVWAPDSKRFVYARHDDVMQPAQLVEHAVPDGPHERTIYRNADSKHPLDWSADGRFILYRVASEARKSDIWVATVSGDEPPYPLLATGYDEIDARFSRDGRWVSDVSDESGRFEVYVRPFKSPRERWQVSAGGGALPRWRADGQELIYVSAEQHIMSVRVHTGEFFGAEAPHALFSLEHLVPEPFTDTPYAMTADARRFLIGTLVRKPSSSPITVMINWTRGLEMSASVH